MIACRFGRSGEEASGRDCTVIHHKAFGLMLGKRWCLKLTSCVCKVPWRGIDRRGGVVELCTVEQPEGRGASLEEKGEVKGRKSTVQAPE